MSESLTEFLASEIRREFAFLNEYGFTFEPRLVTSTPMLIEVPIVGERVTLILSFDVREGVLDFDIASPSPGPAEGSPRFENRMAFTEYLREYERFRGSIDSGVPPVPTDLRERLTRDVKIYSQALRRYGDNVLRQQLDLTKPPPKPPPGRLPR